MLEVRKIINHPTTSNCYIVYDLAIGKRCLIIDPGSESIDEYVDFISALELEPEYIFLTHEHGDHCWGVNDLREQYPSIKVICSRLCSEAIGNAKRNLSAFLHPGKAFAVQPADIYTEDIGGMLEWSGYNVEFLTTPGHTASSISILIDGSLFTGDAWLKDVATYTKLPTGDVFAQRTTEEKLKMLNYRIVYPGHGDSFVINGK